MNYQALTLGPIYKTSQKAESTKGLWAASYLFSFLMKTIIEKLQKSGVAANDFVIPLVADSRLFQPQKGAGLFPDRLIFKTTDTDFEKLNNAIQQALKEFGALTQEAVKKQMKAEKATIPATFYDDYANYLQKYLLIYGISKELPDTANVIEECNKSLSVIEMQQPILYEQSIDFFYYLFEGINKSSLPQRAGLINGRFTSIFEISSGELQLLEADNYDFVIECYLDSEQKSKQEQNAEPAKKSPEQEAIDNFKSYFPNEFKRRHKYIAIVSADGDNMGKAVEQINKKDKQLVAEVGKVLFDFNISAIGIIQEYGGKSIFLGGDDLLFFAPITYGQHKTVFGLMDSISEDYNQKFDALFKKCTDTNPDFWKNEEGQTIAPPTLSFGASITYYKFPLFEAVSAANNLLHEAKKGAKNAVAFQILKHSGQFFGARISKLQTTYSDYFVPILNNVLDDNSFLSSVQFQLRNTADVLAVALEQGRTSVENFFDNFFNEPIHGQKKDFMDDVRGFVCQAYEDSKDIKTTLDIVYSTLRTFQFLNQKDNDDE